MSSPSPDSPSSTFLIQKVGAEFVGSPGATANVDYAQIISNYAPGTNRPSVWSGGGGEAAGPKP